jgi:precorrin-2 dehydrogenase/sirohydrochlorin ferrochelatase
MFLEMEGQRAVVVGAGKVATRKVKSLLDAGAVLTVISPLASAAIRRWAERGKLRWNRRRYRRGDTRLASVVVAATDDLALNERVCQEAKSQGKLVNCIAPPQAGNFIVPSVIRRGGITLAISTGGASPAFAKRLRRDLEEFLGGEYPELLKQMAGE